jgi:hypothetical protein
MTGVNHRKFAKRVRFVPREMKAGSEERGLR